MKQAMDDMATPETAQNIKWKKSGRIIFRILFIYFFVQAFPLDWKYYGNIFHIQWTHLHYRDFFYISRYTPRIVPNVHHPLSWGLNTVADLGIILCIAVVSGIIWSFLDKRRQSYNSLYYLLRVLLRYRLAPGVLAYGFIKLFPMQQPYPSLSLMNTHYGDLSDWKLASLSYGVAPSFEVFLGLVEILGALLLLNRKSASIGAAIIIGFTGNVFLSNLAYGGGESVYCFYLLSMAVVLVFYDAARWGNLLSLGMPTSPGSYKPVSFTGWRKKARWIAKTAFALLAVFLPGFYAYQMYRNDPYQYPRTAGLRDASGFYNVTEFRLNHQLHPYSLTDSLRWQDVVFEKWNTLSIRSLQKPKPDMTNTEEIFIRDEDRGYESAGSDGRRFFTYRPDTLRNTLNLENKNRNDRYEKWELYYKRPNINRLILSGTNEKGDSVYAVLDKIKKIYLLDESYKIPKNRSVFE